MKLVCYEWRKAVSGRAVICLILCCIAVNLGYHGWQCYKEDGLYSQYSGFRKSDWREVTARLQEMEKEEQLLWLGQESTWYGYLACILLGRDDTAEWLWEELQGYEGTDWEKRLKEELPWKREDVVPFDLHKLYNNFESRLVYQESYPEFLETVAQQAESMENMSLFTNVDGFAKRNIEQTAEKYSQLSDIALGIDFSPMVDVGTRSDLADGLLLILVLLLGWQICFREQEEGLYTMLHSAKKGYLPLAGAKAFAFFILLGMVSLLLYGSQMAMAGMIYGIGNMDMAVQSISEYRNCAFPVTVGAYLVLFLGIKIAAAVVLGCLFLIGAAIGNRFHFSAIVYFGIIAAEYGAYRLIDGLSAANVLKYANVFAILDTHACFSEYRNLNLFSYAFPAELAKWIYGIVFLILGTGAFQISFCSDRSRRGRGTRYKIWRKAPVTPGKHSRLLVHESYKFFVLSGMALFLILLGAASVKMATGIPDYSLNQKGEAYRYYVGLLEGKYTDETSELLRREELILDMEDDEARSMQEDLEAGTITQKEYDKWYEGRRALIQVRSEGFLTVLDQEQTILRAAQEYGLDRVGFADTYQLTYLFLDDKNQGIFAVLLLVSIIFSISGLFGIEEQYGLMPLIRSTRHGRQDTMGRKLVLSVIGTTLAYLILYVPYYIRIWMDIRRVPSNILLLCVPGYEAMPLPLTIRQAFWLMVIVRYITAVGCGIITAAAAKRAKKTAIGCVISLLLFVVPCVLFFNGIDLSLLTCMGGFLPELMYRNGNLSGYVCVIAVIAAVSLIAGYDAVHVGKRR